MEFNFRENFENDLKKGMHSMFSDFGIKIPIKKDLHTMLLDYLTIHKKLIRTIPPHVYINPELEDKLKTHPKKRKLNTSEWFDHRKKCELFSKQKAL